VDTPQQIWVFLRTLCEFCEEPLPEGRVRACSDECEVELRDQFHPDDYPARTRIPSSVPVDEEYPEPLGIL
jgi:hypothetical protein